jgi:hypothetical protein
MVSTQPIVEIRTTEMGDPWCGENYEAIEIYIDGEKITEGSFGGEPEDNMRGRTYSWVDGAIKQIAERLGAKVVFTNTSDKEE